MLNMKKGLAVALAAATVLTFAPTSVFAGTTQSGTPSGDNYSVLRTTMNETANVWSYNNLIKGSGTAKALNDENGAVVVLTPSNPTGTVEFTKEITDKDDLSSGKWYKDDGDAATDQTDGALKLTTSKYSKVLKIEASVPYIRSMTENTKITISKAAAARGNIRWISPDSITVNGQSIDTDSFKVTVILTKDNVKMNN